MNPLYKPEIAQHIYQLCDVETRSTLWHVSKDWLQASRHSNVNPLFTKLEPLVKSRIQAIQALLNHDKPVDFSAYKHLEGLNELVEMFQSSLGILPGELGCISMLPLLDRNFKYCQIPVSPQAKTKEEIRQKYIKSIHQSFQKGNNSEAVCSLDLFFQSIKLLPPAVTSEVEQKTSDNFIERRRMVERRLAVIDLLLLAEVKSLESAIYNCTTDKELTSYVESYQKSLKDNPFDKGCFSTLQLQKPAPNCQITTILLGKSIGEKIAEYYSTIITLHDRGERDVLLFILDKCWQLLCPKQHFDELFLKYAGKNYSDEEYQSLKEAALAITNIEDRSIALLDLHAMLRTPERLTEIDWLISLNNSILERNRSAVLNLSQLNKIENFDVDAIIAKGNPFRSNPDKTLSLSHLLCKIRETASGSEERESALKIFYAAVMYGRNLEEGLILICTIDNEVEKYEFLQSFGTELQIDPKIMPQKRELVISKLMDLNVDFSFIQQFFV